MTILFDPATKTNPPRFGAGILEQVVPASRFAPPGDPDGAFDDLDDEVLTTEYEEWLDEQATLAQLAADDDEDAQADDYGLEEEEEPAPPRPASAARCALAEYVAGQARAYERHATAAAGLVAWWLERLADAVEGVRVDALEANVTPHQARLRIEEREDVMERDARAYSSGRSHS